MESDRHDLDVGAGIHVAYVGVNVSFHLDELLDFVTGCFGFDLLDDDAHGRDLDELRRQALSQDAADRNHAFDGLRRRGEPIHGYAIYSAPDARPTFQRRAMEAVQREIAGGSE